MLNQLGFALTIGARVTILGGMLLDDCSKSLVALPASRSLFPVQPGCPCRLVQLLEPTGIHVVALCFSRCLTCQVVQDSSSPAHHIVNQRLCRGRHSASSYDFGNMSFLTVSTQEDSKPRNVTIHHLGLKVRPSLAKIGILHFVTPFNTNTVSDRGTQPSHILWLN